MKKNKIIIYCLSGLLFVSGLISISSCDDFLTITPTDRIVEEEYWEDRNDLESTLASCYIRLLQDDMMRKYIQWGEIRGDNFEKRTGVTAININNIMNANLLSTNGIFDWTSFYNEINYCNKILAHGPDIVASDESFSEGDWQPIKAEVMTIRALCHFWLVRTFGEVPYATTDYNNDSQRFLLKQSTQMEVLDSIIMDLEKVKDVAMVQYGSTSENKARITRKTVYTLLADVYLWRASYKEGAPEQATYGTDASNDYRRCIECCDYVINQMLADYKEQLEKSGKVLGGMTEELTLSDLFIPNVESTSLTGLGSYSATGAYDAIFGTGNSRESIFELQCDGTDNVNSMLLNYFIDKDGNAGSLVCSSALFSATEDNPNTTLPSSLFTNTDYRRWETAKFSKAEQTEYPLAKYSYDKITQYSGSSASYGMRNNSATSFKSSTSESRPRGTMNDANWIFYRLSDVVLMKAEAMVQLSEDEENLQNAFNLVREVFKRSNPYAYQNTTSASDSLNFKVYSTKDAMTKLILNERQREFVGEGKRWFDLVRFAQRNGNTVEMLKYLTRKFTDNQRAIEAKLGAMKSLFSPIYTNELKNNGLLHQNEVWGTTESTSRTDEM